MGKRKKKERKGLEKKRKKKKTQKKTSFCVFRNFKTLRSSAYVGKE
jgi:hypothetical protein